MTFIGCLMMFSICSSVLHSIESRNQDKHDSGTKISAVSSPIAQNGTFPVQKTILSNDISESKSISDSPLTKKEALLDQPIRIFTTKPGNTQV